MSGFYPGNGYKSYHKTVSDLPHGLTYMKACEIVQEYKSSKRRKSYAELAGVPVAPNTILRIGHSWENGVHEKWAKVRYWNTDIVTIFGNGSFTVDYGGHFDSPSTKARIQTLVGFSPAYSERNQECLSLQWYGSSPDYKSGFRAEHEHALRFFQWRPRQKRIQIPWIQGIHMNPKSDRSLFGRVFFMGISWEDLEQGASLVNLEQKTDRYPGGVPLRAVSLWDFAHGCPMPGHEFSAPMSVTPDGQSCGLGSYVKTRVVVDLESYQERERVLGEHRKELRDEYDVQALSVRLAARSALVALVQSLAMKLSCKELPEKSSKLVNDWVKVISPVARGDQNITKLLERCQRIIDGSDVDTLKLAGTGQLGQDYQAGLDKELSKAMCALEDLLVNRPGRKFSLELEQEEGMQNGNT